MIHLPVKIGPYEFQVTFHILDIPAAYNMLLGRPWIHPTGAVPSTLHQNVKYAIDVLLVIVYGEQEFATFGKPLLPHISAGEETEPILYQVFELVSATFAHEGKLTRKPAYSQAHLIMARQLKTDRKSVV